MHGPQRRAGLCPALAGTVVFAVGCAGHASAPPRPPHRPASAAAGFGAPAAVPAEPATPSAAAARAAAPVAVAFVRGALRAGPAGRWWQRAGRYTTTRLQHRPSAAPPAVGRVRVLTAQLATDTPSTAGVAHVEVAALVASAGGGTVLVTAYVTLTRGRGGWLVDAVQSWT